jgi:cobalt/nickel transport protein
VKKLPFFLATFLLFLIFPLPGQAHFGMIIPSLPTVTATKDAKITLTLKFWHPFANQGMNLDKPAAFAVTADGSSTNLLPSLTEDSEQSLRIWKAAYTLKRPGLYVFSMEPVPYFEKEEDCFIVHYTKVYVDAFGDDEGWDKPLGLKTEIVPLVRPGGLYAGNSFQGQVLLDGKPVPHSEVEIEWYPGSDRRGQAPTESLITQTVKADAAGIFTYTAPREGWWGFAALNEAGKGLPFQGQEKPVELGAVLWVHFQPLLPAVPLQ